MKTPFTSPRHPFAPLGFTILLAALFALLFTPAAHAVGGATLSPVLLQFPAAAVGSVGTTQTETITIFGFAGPFTTALHYNIDYSLGAVTCTGTGTITCTIAVNFRPTLPGMRRDAIFLTNSNGRVATVLISGVGNAPLEALQPGVFENASGLTSLGAGHYSAPVTDEKHVVYFFFNNNLYSSSYLNGPTLLMSNATSGDGYDLAIDGAGVLYWGLGSTSPATAGPAINTYDTVQNLSGTYLFQTNDLYYSVATDGFGDVFAYGRNSNKVQEFTPAAVSSATAVSPAVASLSQMATDPAGNLFLGGTTLNELAAGGT